MNKISKLSLKDWLNDPTDIRLKIFIKSVNPGFETSRAAINDIKSILNDYRTDNNPSRLKLIENYLGGTSVKPKTKKPSVTDMVLTSNPKQKELILLAAEFKKLMSSPGLTEIKKTRLSEVRDKIDTLEEELGLKVVDPDAQAKYEKSLVLSILGDWEKPGTYSYELINGSRPKFEIADERGRVIGGFDMNVVMRYLAKHSGKQVRKFAARFIMPMGSVGQSKWVFLEVDSGLSYGNNSLTVNGREISEQQIMDVPEAVTFGDIKDTFESN